MKRAAGGSLFLVVLALSVLSSSTAGAQDAKSLLGDSYQASQQLSIQDRAFFLVRLTDISTSISPGRTETWCGELLGLTSTLPPNWNRVSTTKNALVPLSRVNPERALSLLARVEKPIRHDGILSEDVRADAAVTIYINYFRVAGVSGLDNIRQNADAIGDNGEYPYRAVGLVIENLAAAHAKDKLATDIFNRALHYYTRGSEFQDEDEQFFQLLQSAQFVVDEGVYKKGLKEFIEHLTTSKSKEPAKFQAEAYSVDGVFSFDSQKKLLLFEIYPTIVRLDEQRARDLVQKYPWLAHAGSGVNGVAASGTSLQPSSENAGTTQQKMNDNLLERRIGYLQDSNPISAVRDARLLSEDTARALAFSSILRTLAQSDQSEALDVYDELRSLVDTLPEGRSKLRGMVALARAAYYVNNSNDFSDVTAQALAYGGQLFEKSPVAAGTLQRLGALELTDLADFVAEHQGDRLLARIRSVPDDGLRAYLLLFTAKGLGKAEATEKMLAAGRASVAP